MPPHLRAGAPSRIEHRTALSSAANVHGRTVLTTAGRLGRTIRERKLAGKRERYAAGPQVPESAKVRSRLRRKELNLWHNYGLTPDDYDLMVTAQRGLCAICKRRPQKKLCVDHCHATRRLRFLPCNNCNSGLGYFEDDPRLLRRALAYVEFWRKLLAAGTRSWLVPGHTPRTCRKTAGPALLFAGGTERPPERTVAAVSLSHPLLTRDSETPADSKRPPTASTAVPLSPRLDTRDAGQLWSAPLN